MGWEFQNQDYDGIDKAETRLYFQGDMSGNVNHGTSLSEGWEVLYENNATVGVDHARSWTENAYTERDQSHKIVWF